MTRQRVVRRPVGRCRCTAWAAASLTWWGTLVFMLIEGTGFALVIAIYLYLASPRIGLADRCAAADLLPGTLLTAAAAAQPDPEHADLPLGRQGRICARSASASSS